MIIIVMGVSGSGKTTIGTLLAKELGWSFYEGDELHPPSNIEKMKHGIPLTDEDREPWLDKIQKLIQELTRKHKQAVIACSALKEPYRKKIGADRQEVRFVYLKGDAALIASRMRRRRGHFMPPDLLASQFATLEEPEKAVSVDISKPPQEIVKSIEKSLSLKQE